MAIISNIDETWTAPLGTLVTVGNNRQIAREEEDGHPLFTCYLHGHPVARIKPHGRSGTATVRLDDCGHLTVTTVRAMGEFMAAYGVRGSASRAGGVLSVQWLGADGKMHQREATEGRLSFAAARYGVEGVPA